MFEKEEKLLKNIKEKNEKLNNKKKKRSNLKFTMVLSIILFLLFSIIVLKNIFLLFTSILLLIGTVIAFSLVNRFKSDVENTLEKNIEDLIENLENEKGILKLNQEENLKEKIKNKKEFEDLCLLLKEKNFKKINKDNYINTLNYLYFEVKNKSNIVEEKLEIAKETMEEGRDEIISGFKKMFGLKNKEKPNPSKKKKKIFVKDI